MENPDIQTLIEEATFQYTMGEDAQALELIEKALALDPDSFAAWHAKTEVLFSTRDLDSALEAAEKAHKLKPEDIHINTSLSRIWVEKGDKAKAEHYNAQARMLGWKGEIQAAEGKPSAEN